jgi:hypothetical protein
VNCFLNRLRTCMSVRAHMLLPRNERGEYILGTACQFPGTGPASHLPPYSVEAGGWPELSLSTTLQGAPLKLGLGAVFANANRRNDPQFFSAPRGPVGFDLDHSTCACEIVTEAAPSPVLGALHQSTHDRIAMDVSQLLHKFALAPHVEIVVTCLGAGPT